MTTKDIYFYKKRNELIKNGFCVIENILSNDFVDELTNETNIQNCIQPHHPDTKYQGTHIYVKYNENTVFKKLFDWKPTKKALNHLKLCDFEHTKGLFILTKKPNDPALYWHQDWNRWNDPLSSSPWPQQIFLSYYLDETNIKNGCLKIIPGTHLKKISLHDELVEAHEKGARFINENHPVMFSNQPNQINLKTKSGSVVIGDARVLHGAHRNSSNLPRNMLLIWYTRPDSIPENWVSNIPECIKNRKNNVQYLNSRKPSIYLSI